MQENLSHREESHPAQVIEYALQMSVVFEPSFNWWGFHVLNQHDDHHIGQAT